MNHKLGRLAFTLMILLALTWQLDLNQIKAQEAQMSKQRFTVVGY